MFLEPPTSTEIIAALRLLSLNKAVGHDQIPPYFLRIAVDVIAPYLVYFFQVSFIKGIFRESCTIVKGIPLHKKGYKTNSLTTALFHFFLAYPKLLNA